MKFSGGNIAHLSAHFIGNKSLDGRLILTDNEYYKEDQEELYRLTEHFLDPMKDVEEAYYFYHDVKIELNEVYHVAKAIFDDNTTFHENSKNLAHLLYSKSVHPKVNEGDLYVVLFDDCILEGKVMQALGLYKVEQKHYFMKSGFDSSVFSLAFEQGVGLKKVDKSAIIFYTDEDEGYKLLLSDKKTGGMEAAQYWKDDFLQVRPFADNYHHTQNYLTLTKDYVTNKLNEQFEVSKVDQVDLLNRSVDYFKKNEEFDEQQFTEEVFGNSNVIESFKKYKEEYQDERDIEIAGDFEISATALKKQSRIFKSVIKLDKNFHVYIHGNNDLIEKGFDATTGKNFYKIFFDEES